MSQSWKNFERRAAAILGGVRNAFSGAAPYLTGTAADVRHPYLFPECKYRKRHAAVKVWDVARAKADRENKIPIVLLAEKGRPGCWILIYSGDLDKLSEGAQ